MIPEPCLISPEGDQLRYDSLTRRFTLRLATPPNKGKSEYTVHAPSLVATLHFAAGAGGSFRVLPNHRHGVKEAISLLLVVETLRVLIFLAEPSTGQLVQACDGPLDLDVIASPREIWTREDLTDLGFGRDLGSPVDGGQTR